MSPDIQVFCAMAIGRRLLTLDQCDLLMASCRSHSTKDIITVLDSHGIGDKRDALAALAQEIADSPIGKAKRKSSADTASEGHEGSSAAPMPPERLAVEWFCFLAVARGLAGSNACKTTAERMDKPLRLRPFIKALIAERIIDGAAQVDSIMQKAKTLAGSGKWPPTCLLSAKPLRHPQQTRSPNVRSMVDAVSRNSAQQQPDRAKKREHSTKPIPLPDKNSSETAKPPSLDTPQRRPLAEKKRIFTGGDLTKPHPGFPSWSCETIYDLVAGMYLDSLDSVEVADELSAARCAPIHPGEVEVLRREAADAAARHPDIAVRRKWAWRHKSASIDNLAREYMFLIEGKDLQTAKRELASEIAWFLKTEDRDRLILAVNDALGRSDIEWHVILEFAAFHEAATKLDALAVPIAKKRGMPTTAYLAHVAQALAKEERSSRGADDSARRVVGQLLERSQKEITSDDLSYLRGLSTAGLRVLKTSEKGGGAR